MAMTNPNDPAYPGESKQFAISKALLLEKHPELEKEILELRSHVGGLTKREYFAAMALQGLCSQAIFVGSHTSRAVEMADALIAELSKEEK